MREAVFGAVAKKLRCVPQNGFWLLIGERLKGTTPTDNY